MSRGGLFLTFCGRPDRPFETGREVRLGITLEHGDPRGGPLVVRCQGTVVRLEPAADAPGIAVSFESYQFALGHDIKLLEA